MVFTRRSPGRDSTLNHCPGQDAGTVNSAAIRVQTSAGVGATGVDMIFKSPGAQVTVRREGEQLMAQITGQPAFPIYPSAPLEFFWRVANAQVRFLEEGGKVTGAVLTQDGRTVEMEKVG